MSEEIKRKVWVEISIVNYPIRVELEYWNWNANLKNS